MQNNNLSQEFDPEAQNILVLQSLCSGKILTAEIARKRLEVGYLPARIHDIGKRGIRAEREPFKHIKASGRECRMVKYWLDLEDKPKMESAKKLLALMRSNSKKQYTVTS